jgi:hypothetical protein
MILSRLRYRPVKVLGPTLQNVIPFFLKYIPLPCVMDRDTIVTCVTAYKINKHKKYILRSIAAKTCRRLGCKTRAISLKFNR